MCSAGKFGERWAEIAKAYGLNADRPERRIRRRGERRSGRRRACRRTPAYKGVFVQASETSTGAQHDVQGMAAAIKNTDALFVVDAITGLGTHAARYRRLGPRRRRRRIAEVVHDPAGTRVSFRQREGVGARRFLEPAEVLLQPEEGTEERGGRRIELDSEYVPDHRARRSAEIHQSASAWTS